MMQSHTVYAAYILQKDLKSHLLEKTGNVSSASTLD